MSTQEAICMSEKCRHFRSMSNFLFCLNFIKMVGDDHFGIPIFAQNWYGPYSLNDQWLLSEWPMATLWMTNGYSMNDQWLLSEWPMATLWMTNGYSLNDQWLLSEWPMATLWMINGYSLNYQWLLSELSMATLWIINGYSLNHQWLLVSKLVKKL